MLKGIDPLIGPDLLKTLALMGHGDEIVVADGNFPAESIARRTACGSALAIGCDAVRALSAILSLMPLDEDELCPVVTMQIIGDPDTQPPVVLDALPVLAGHGQVPTSIERFGFYERASRAFAIVRTLETRPYGNFILRKGVVTV